MNTNNLNTQGFSCLSLPNLDDDTDFIELNDSYMQELSECLDNSVNAESNVKAGKHENSGNKKVEDVTMVNPNILPKENNSDDSGQKSKCEVMQIDLKFSSSSNTSLKAAIENFIKNIEMKDLKINTFFRKGLCFSWLSNNYVCTNEQCIYNHNALQLFTRKLKMYPSKFIMTVVVSMRNDILFVDMVMAAFKVITERKIPDIWLRFLIIFVFYVIKPSDSRFLKFWANAARFLSQLDKKYSAANGFASLLSIIYKGGQSEEGKIIEFIELIRQPPVQVHINYGLLQPILKMGLPQQFLTEAIESCIATQTHVSDIYSSVIPKICLKTSPIHVVELLLKLSKTLEEVGLQNYANDLKQRLREKVLSFKMKITSEYPLTAYFQEEILHGSNQESIPVDVPHHSTGCTSPKVISHEEKIETETELENNVFQLEEDFCNLVTQVMAISHETLPSRYRSAEDVCERQINRIRQCFRDYQFDLLGKHLNELKPNAVERAAEEFLKLLFRMKISLQQGADLIKIILLPCKTVNAAKVIASISISVVLNLVRINEWEKAYTIVSLCQGKEINLLEGKVFCFKESTPVSQCRIALLLVEIYAYKENYSSALDLIKKYFLFSSNNTLWQLTWRENDEIIRVRIIEDLLQQMISKQLTVEAYDLYELIFKEQKERFEPVDLKNFTDEILILLLNQNDNEALNLYGKIKGYLELDDITLRAIVVTLVRRNHLTAAKSVLLSPKQNTYSLPEIVLGTATIKVSSFWLEEEIFAVFDVFFDLFIAKKPNINLIDNVVVEIKIQIPKPNPFPGKDIVPLCLGIISPSKKDACARIQRVLQYQFKPPLKLYVMPYCTKLDADSVRLQINKRMNQN